MKNIFIQKINFAEYSNSENLEELVKDTYERLEVITESALQNKQKVQEKQKKYYDKNLKKKKKRRYQGRRRCIDIRQYAQKK